MSLYNVLFGRNPLADALLEMLDLKNGTWYIPRFRDCWWDGEYIVVLTRTGGGNRDEYESSNNALHKHPEFVSDSDNEFDPTYAEFRFRLPEKWKHIKPKLDEFSGRSLGERFDEVMQKLDKLDDPESKNDPQVKRILEFSERLFGAIKKSRENPDSPTTIEV